MSNAERPGADTNLEIDGDRPTKLFVDSCCVGCKETSVQVIDPLENAWKRAGESVKMKATSTFVGECTRCGEDTYHNILAFLTKLNEGHDDAVTIDELRGGIQ